MKSYVFDDGSIESKVLQFEFIGKDVETIKVGKYNLEEWITSIPPSKDIVRVYLHFCYEDYVTSVKDIRADITTLLHKYPNLRIVAQYEQTDRASIKRRASNYNILVPTYQFKDNKMTKKEDTDVEQILEDNKEKIKLIEYNKEKAATVDYTKYSVGGESKEVVPPHIGQDLEEDKAKEKQSFTEKTNWFRDRRRRKKKDKNE